jgi:transcriptional regulator with XRE-family HTH domain
LPTELSTIGDRLQALRRDAGLTLEQLATETGFSTGYLSQIETGAAVPSLTALQVIAAEFGVDLATFFPEEHERGTRVVRASDRRAFRLEPGSGEEYAILSGQVHERQFTAIHAVHLPGAQDVPFHHLGEEFGLVLSGRLRITIDGDVHDFGPGEWFHYSSHPRHSGVVLSDEPVTALWFLAPGIT